MLSVISLHAGSVSNDLPKSCTYLYGAHTSSDEHYTILLSVASAAELTQLQASSLQPIEDKYVELSFVNQNSKC